MGGEVDHNAHGQRVASGLYDLLVLGTTMFESPTVDNIMRLAASGVSSVSSCSLVAAYLVRGGTFIRVAGEPNRHLDLLVEASRPSSGPLDSDLAGSTYALFTHGGSTLTGCLVLTSPAPPTADEVFLLHALAAPTGAALATAELIESERDVTATLRRAAEDQTETNAAMSEMIRRLNAHQHVRDSIARAAGSDGGSGGIARALHLLAGLSVLVQDPFGNELAYAGLPRKTLSPVLSGDAPWPAAKERRDGWLVAPIQARDEIFGSLGIYDPDDSLANSDPFPIDCAATSLAIELSHDRNLAEVELRLGRDLVADLISGADAEGSITRADARHYNLALPQSVVLVSWEPCRQPGTTLELVLQQAFARIQVPALVARRHDAAIAVTGAFDTAMLFAHLAETMGNSRGAIGVGSIGAAADLPTSFAEAQRALQVRSRLHEPNGVTLYDDLGLDRILDCSNGGVEIEGFVSEWLGSLLEHDREKQSDLVITLAAYLDAGGNYDATATALLIHRSTLRYRLARIREFCGRDFSDPDVRLNLHVAVRAWSVMCGRTT